MGVQFNPVSAGYFAPSAAETTPAAPAKPSSITATFLMQGLGALIVPNTPAANILCMIGGYVAATGTTTADGIALQLYYGPMVAGVAAPANTNAVPAAAIALGGIVQCGTGTTLGSSGGSAYWPLAVFGIARGLVPGQQYWFDLGAYCITTVSNFEILAPNIVLAEIG